MTVGLTVCERRALSLQGLVCGAVWLWLISLGFALALLAILRRLKFDAWLTAIVLCAVVLYLHYGTYTGIAERNYDGQAHYFYANYVAEHGRLPPSQACTVCGHPPAYYLLGAASIRLGQWLSLTTPAGALQGLSVWLTFGFVVWGILTLQCFPLKPAALRWGAALLAFWPTCVIQSARVHDDALLSFLGAGILYHLIRWNQRDHALHLATAVALTSLAVFTKANAYAWVLLLLAVVGARCFKERFSGKRIAQTALVAAISVVSAYFASELRTAKAGTGACHRMLGVICNISSEHYVGNSWRNYLQFDVPFFLNQPFMISDPQDVQRDFVWNVFLKSSLIGAMPLGSDFETPYGAYLATGLSYLELGLLLFLFAGMTFVVTRQVRPNGVLVFASLFMVVQLVALRILVPLSWHSDFRYTFALLVPIAAAYSGLLSHCQARARPVVWVGGAMSLLWVACVVGLFGLADAPLKSQPDRAPQVLFCSTVQWSEVRNSGTPLEDSRNLHFGPRQSLEFALPPGTQVSNLDISLDADDQYEVLIKSTSHERRVLLGPATGVRGLVRYQRSLRLPVRDAQSVTVRAIDSDGDYTLGHLKLTSREPVSDIGGQRG